MLALLILSIQLFCGDEKEADRAAAAKDQTEEMLAFLCPNTKGWRLSEILLSRSGNPAGTSNLTYGVEVRGFGFHQVAALAPQKKKEGRSGGKSGRFYLGDVRRQKIIEIAETETTLPWSKKLVIMADLTPFYVGVAVNSVKPPALRHLLAQFGEPEDKVPGELSFGHPIVYGDWYVYGRVRIGVTKFEKNGEIYCVQVDGTAKGASIEEGDANDIVTKDIDARLADARIVNAKDEMEKKADHALSLASALIKVGKADKARERYKKIIRDFPETKASNHAKKLLAQLEK